MKGLLSPPRRPQINSRSQPDARGAWFAGRSSMRAPKTRTLDHFLFSPRLRNASGTIIHRNRVPIVFPIFFCFGRNAAIWFYRDYRSQRDCFAHSDGNCTGWSDICLLTIRSIESNKNGALLATPFVTLSVERGRSTSWVSVITCSITVWQSACVLLVAKSGNCVRINNTRFKPKL